MTQPDPLPPFSGDNPTCAQCGHVGAATKYRPHGNCMHPTDGVLGYWPNPRLHRTCGRCDHMWDEATAEQAREDGPTGACEPPCCSVDPEPTEHENDAQTGADALDVIRRAMARATDPDQYVLHDGVVTPDPPIQCDGAPAAVPSRHQPAYDAVYAYIRELDAYLPTDPVHRNAMIWRAVNAALDAANGGRP